MKNYIVSLSKRALLLSGALAIFTACDDGDLGDFDVMIGGDSRNVRSARLTLK